MWSRRHLISLLLRRNNWDFKVNSFEMFLLLSIQVISSWNWCLPVEEYAADIIMSYGRFLGTGSHAKRSQEVVDKDVELLDVFRLCFQHAKDDLVPLPHALCMWRTDVVLNDGLPLSPTHPAPQEALHLEQQHKQQSINRITSNSSKNTLTNYET